MRLRRFSTQAVLSKRFSVARSLEVSRTGSALCLGAGPRGVTAARDVKLVPDIYLTLPGLSDAPRPELLAADTLKDITPLSDATPPRKCAESQINPPGNSRQDTCPLSAARRGRRVCLEREAGVTVVTDMPKPDLLCLVQLLDGTIETFRVSKQDEGLVLLDLVSSHLGLQEKQLFSLQIRESSTAIASIAANTLSPRWLEPEKSFKKQIKGLASPFYLNFRVRFFISDPNSLQHEQTRHLYFLQIRSDIREGRLQCPLSAAVVLASYAVQSEMGDHCPSRQPGYLSKCHFIPEQDEDFVSKVEDLHPQHKGLKQSEAELCFLNTARTLELYGVELHAATDTNNTPLMVGLASSGVAMFCNMICSSFFPWGNIIKISYKRRRFVVHLKRKHGETQDCEVSLNLPCPKTCKNLWRSCVDHHSFFSSSRTARSPKYNNSTVKGYKQLITQHLGLSNSKTEEGPVCQRVVGGMVWNPVLQRSISSEHLETKSLPSRSPPSTPNWRSPRVRHEIRKPRPSSVELSTDLKDMSEGEDVFYTYRASVGSSKDSEGDASSHRFSAPNSQGSGEGLLQAEDSIGEEDSPFHNNKDALGDGDLMLICITPDHEGKFGFNVKGGVDQKMPLSISHVKPDSPAGRSEPRLQEGDLVLLINGRDISEHTHDQVVMYIRASRESHSRQLALLIRRKGSGRVMPQLQLSFAALSLTIPPQENKPQSPGQLERVTTLEESMKQLERGIQSGTLSFHFETTTPEWCCWGRKTTSMPATSRWHPMSLECVYVTLLLKVHFHRPVLTFGKLYGSSRRTPSSCLRL
ncbi:tyrosine-protein phosphatase non-receptor type 3-like isoform X2 [Poecilia latipinna]|uniref:tyrosine-protein phosphatase non-receptor type 3-like isoform X2 n=1 Tax=Poecilia latipinna TaxID=48699 RepID=UPI00072E6835|nr:PREDICTED: tyrosine-protein phosphatase non-receptor type 3-like isoform X2 [Poecilia latipinna]